MTNAIILPLTADMELVISADNSGSIGEKKDDIVKASNQIVGHFSCRVALMECLAEYAEPQAVIMQNFTNDAAWIEYKRGVHEVLAEIGIANLPITGSTESNFPSLQSGLGLSLIGTRKKRATYEWTGRECFAVIGTPYVGDTVLENREEIATISLLKQFTEIDGVKAVLPVGSKGIRSAFEKWTEQDVELECAVDLETTAGPATCFIVAFDSDVEEELRMLAGELFHLLEVKQKSME